MRPYASGDATRLAEEIIQQMESLVVKELPRVAGTFTTALESLHAQLEAANAEVERLRKERLAFEMERSTFRYRHDDDKLHLAHLRQLYSDLERLHEQDEARLAELERERAEYAEAWREDEEKLAAVDAFVKMFVKKD